MNQVKRHLLPIVIATLTLQLIRAQSPRPEFEVASLKPNPSGLPGFGIRALPAGLTATNISLKRLIAMGYSVTDFQIFGDLPWLETQRFDLEAKAGGLAALPQLRPMVQSLLDERFKLKIHRETRDMSRYTMTLVKSGKPGPGLVQAPDTPCGPPVAPQAAAPNSGRPPQAPCGIVNVGRGRIFGQRGRISQLADRLSTLLGRTVVDDTSLTGSYDIEVTFAPDPDLVQASPAGVASDPAGPSIFTALQEQLGLKLQSGKGPVEVIVVDSAEKPVG